MYYINYIIQYFIFLYYDIVYIYYIYYIINIEKKDIDKPNNL